MKRIALIVLTATYLLSCVGIGINRFYCCGKLASVTLTYSGFDHTNKTKAKNDNCCKNEKQSFKIKDNHFSAGSFSFNQQVPAIISSFISLHTEKAVQLLQASIAYRGNAPPGCPAIPAYTLNCNYRI